MENLIPPAVAVAVVYAFVLVVTMWVLSLFVMGSTWLGYKLGTKAINYFETWDEKQFEKIVRKM